MLIVSLVRTNHGVRVGRRCPRPHPAARDTIELAALPLLPQFRRVAQSGDAYRRPVIYRFPAAGPALPGAGDAR